MGSPRVTPQDRFSPTDPCPICTGDPTQPKGSGLHCWGYYSEDRRFAFCTHEEYGGERTRSGMAVRHYLGGPCRCGKAHGAVIQPTTPRAPKQRKWHSQIPLSLASGHEQRRHWDYRRADGSLALREVRFIHPTARDAHGKPDKKCYPYIPAEDNGGGWYNELPPEHRVLYGLPKLVAPVYITEGPKCADIVGDLGLLGICAPGGAKAWMAMPEEERHPHLRARHVVILADAGDDGEAFAMTVAIDLLDVAASVKVVLLDGLADGEDIEQWLARPGNDRERLETIVQVTPSLKYSPAQPLELSVPEAGKEPDKKLLAVVELDRQADAWNGPASVKLFTRALRREIGIPYRHDSTPVRVSLTALGKRLGKSAQAVSKDVSKAEALGIIEKHYTRYTDERTGLPRTELAIAPTALFDTPTAWPVVERGHGGKRSGAGRKCKSCGSAELAVVCRTCGSVEELHDHEHEHDEVEEEAQESQENSPAKQLDSHTLSHAYPEAIKLDGRANFPALTLAERLDACAKAGHPNREMVGGQLVCADCDELLEGEAG